MSNMDRVHARVAAIVDERELVLNRGEEHGVQVGMRFAILAGEGTEVKDPETGEILGLVPIEKTTVKVVRVQPKLSVARTFRTVGGSPGILGAPNLQATLYGTKPRPERLATNEQGLRQALNEEAMLVGVGDAAVEVAGAEYED